MIIEQRDKQKINSRAFSVPTLTVVVRIGTKNALETAVRIGTENALELIFRLSLCSMITELHL